MPKIRQTIYFGLKLSVLTSFLLSGLITSFHCCAAQTTESASGLVHCCNNRAAPNSTFGSEGCLTVNPVQVADCLLCELISQFDKSANSDIPVVFISGDPSDGYFKNQLAAKCHSIRKRGRDPPLGNLDTYNHCP
jgi:hypothetical protein